MMIEKRANDYKVKFYKVTFVFVTIVLQCLFLLFFVSNESKNAQITLQNTLSKKNQIQQQKEQILKSLNDFKNFNNTWALVDQKKIQSSQHNANDIIIFLNSTAKKLGIKDFVVEITDQTTNDYYSIVNAKIKFGSFNEPSILLLIDNIISMSEDQIFLKKLTIEKNIDNKVSQLNKVVLDEFQKKVKESIDKITNGERYESLPNLLSVNMEIEVLLVK